jgi:hypothetical protein
MLKKDCFSAQVIARGEATDKRRKKLLDKAFAVSPEDEEKLLAEQVERSTAKNRRAKADVEDQVACLVLKKRTSGKDPPDNKTKNILKVVYASGASGAATHVPVQLLSWPDGIP